MKFPLFDGSSFTCEFFRPFQAPYMFNDRADLFWHILFHYKRQWPMFEWMHANGIQYSVDSTVNENPVIATDDPAIPDGKLFHVLVKYHLNIRDPDQALLFKLRWSDDY